MTGRGSLFAIAAALLALLFLALASHTWSGSCATASAVLVTPGYTNALVAQFLAAPAPAVNSNISADLPLFFFHQRKTAGSAARTALVAAAETHGLPYFVPCFGNVSCDTYHIGTAVAALYAGHIPWAERKELARRAAYQPANGTWVNPSDRASCLTVFRAPVARMESCYYYRFIQERGIAATEHRLTCLSNLTEPEISSFLRYGRSMWGRGCLNEAFRILSGVNDETAIAQMTMREGGAVTFQPILAMTLHNLAKCVPLVLEMPESFALVDHFFPQFASTFASMPRENTGQVGRCALSAESEAALVKLANDGGEQLLYDSVKQRVTLLLSSIAN